MEQIKEYELFDGRVRSFNDIFPKAEQQIILRGGIIIHHNQNSIVRFEDRLQYLHQGVHYQTWIPFSK